MSAPYTTYSDDQNIPTLNCLNYSCYDEGLTLRTSAPYTTYSDDHKKILTFNDSTTVPLMKS